MPSKLAVPGKRLSPNDVETYVDDINEALQAVDDSIDAYNQQIDAKDLAEQHAATAKEQSDRASTIVLTPLLQIRKSKLDNPLCHLFKKNKLVDTLQGELTWSRATTATYIDRYGVLKTAAIDQSRQEVEGWLIEGPSTNYMLYSEDITQSSWVKTGVATVAGNDTALAPDGNMTADKLVMDNSTGVHYMYQPDSVTGEYTVSIFFKAGEYTTAGFDVFSVADGTVGACIVDLVTGELSDVTGSAKSEIIGNGWVRVSLTVTITDSTSYTRIYPNNRYASPGDGTSGVYVWGAQLEKLPFASSYIPTTNSAATRAADQVSIPFYGNMLTPVSNFSISTSFSILGWVNYNNIFATSSNFADGKMQAFAHPTSTVATNLGGVGNAVSSPGISLQGENQRYTLVGDGEFYNAYSDDKVGAAKAIVNPVIGSDTHFILGASSMSGSSNLFGHLNDFRIYDFALNSDEVSFLAGE